MRSHSSGIIPWRARQRRPIAVLNRLAREAGWLASGFATVSFLVFGAGSAAAQSCVAPTYKAARAAFGCEYIRLLRAQRTGDPPDFTACEQQLQKKMTRASGRYDACAPGLDVQQAVDACVAAAQSLVDPGQNHRCRGRYYVEARAFSRCGIGGFLKNLRTGDPVDLIRCRRRLTRVLDRTQSRVDGCPSVTTPAFEAALLNCLESLTETIEGTPSTPTPTPSATETPVATDTPAPAPTDTPAPTVTETPEPTATSEPDPTDTPVPTTTETPEPTATSDPDPTDTPIPTATDTPEPTATATLPVDPTDTPEPTDTPTAEPTNTPTSEPTDTPTPEPTATPSDTPTEVPTVPSEFRRVFVTSTTTNGNFPDGVEGADAYCQDLADAAGLPGRFVAWLSTGNSTTQARDRLENAPVPYYLVDGTKVADDFNDLVDGSLDAPINLDENGTLQSAATSVWTGSAADGSGVSGFNDNVRCRQWTSSAGGDGGRVGSSNATNSNWTNSGTNASCDNLRRLYCFQSNHRTVFVTSTAHDGNFGGVRGADAFCQTRADDAGLDGHYVAWLSTGDGETRATDRIEHAPAPYRLVDGTRIAINWDDLSDGTLENPISLDETGAEQSLANGVWTGSAGNGTGVSGGNTAVRCAQWASNSSSHGGRVGSSNATNSNWSNTGNNVSCDQPRRLYCVESQLKCGVGSKCIFRTFEGYTANLGGLAGADAKCQAAADSSSGVARGVYKAWLSTASESASARLTHATVPYVLPTGDKVANNWTDLTDGSNLSHSIKYNQHDANYAGPVCNFRSAWTATSVAGLYVAGGGSGSCNEWTSTSGTTRLGDSCMAGTAWTNDQNNSCNVSSSLYCFQQ